MKRMSVAMGMLACLLAGCAEPTSAPLIPIGPGNVSMQAKTALTPTVSSPSPCTTRVEWDGSGVAEVVHFVELDGGNSLAVRVSPDKPPRSSTVQWNPGSFGTTGRVPTGRVRATLNDHKGSALASTDWVEAGFTCGS